MKILEKIDCKLSPINHLIKEGYEIQPTPDESARLSNGSEITPVVTLKSDTGGISHIIVDDGCYVLVNGGQDKDFEMVAHIYPEAFEALISLPPL